MKRSLTLFEMVTISKASKAFGKYVNEMIAHTSLFDTEVQQHSFSYKVSGVRFNDIVTYTRTNESLSVRNCDETSVVTCNIILPKYTKRNLKWFLTNIVSNDGLCSGRKLRTSQIDWALEKMWNGLRRYSSCDNEKYIEFEVYKFRVTTNKDGSYKLQAYINIL